MENVNGISGFLKNIRIFEEFLELFVFLAIIVEFSDFLWCCGKKKLNLVSPAALVF
jgi:hypothetical protein